MNHQDEYSPYMSDAPRDTYSIFDNYMSPFGIFILIIIGIFIYFAYFATPKESFNNASRRSDPSADEDYLEMQIDLLNRQQHKNMS